ncbi:MAG: SGNH/GDSL hydrolase family protein [bacterium]
MLEKMTVHKKVCFWILLITLTALMCMVSAEVLLRIFSISTTYYGYSPSYPYVYDPFVAKRHRPNSQFNFRTKEFEIQFVTNSEGFRASNDFLTGDDRNRVIAIIGDSFVQAIQVDESATFVKLLETQMRDLGINQVQNYGVAGLGIVHYLQMYKFHVRKHNPEIVFIFILDANDITNSSPLLEPPLLRPSYIYDGKGEILDVDLFADNPIYWSPEDETTHKPFMFTLRYFLGSHSALYRFASFLKVTSRMQEKIINPFPVEAYVYEEPWSDEFEQAWKHATWALENLVQEIKKDSASPWVVLIPAMWTTSDKYWQLFQERYPGTGYLDKNKVRNKLHEFTAKKEVDFIDLTHRFLLSYSIGEQPHFPVNGHLTALGHKLVAEEIYDRLIRDVWVNNKYLLN